MTMFRRIDHIGLTPSDFDRSLTFYTEVLGFKAKQRISIDVHPIRGFIYLELGDTVLELLDVVNPAGPGPEGRRVGFGTIAIEVENMDDALAYLAGKGISPSVEPRTGDGGTRRAEIKDPDGLSIELRQW
jgi:glyoxylase I family protein